MKKFLLSLSFILALAISSTTVFASTPARTLTILSPKGGETFHQGDKMKVTWRSSGYGPTSIIAIDLTRMDMGGGNANTFLMSVAELKNDGEETLTIPSTIPEGTNYGLHMSVYDPDTTLWQSAGLDKPFTIITTRDTSPTPASSSTSSSCRVDTRPWIKILTPNGKEKLRTDRTFTVKWKSCNLPPDTRIQLNLAKASVTDTSIPLITEDAYQTMTNTNLVDNTGKAKVHTDIKNFPTYAAFKTGKDFKVYIMAQDPSTAVLIADDYSDKFFSIKK